MFENGVPFLFYFFFTRGEKKMTADHIRIYRLYADECCRIIEKKKENFSFIYT